MRRKRNNQEESLTGRQRWAIYRKLFMEARPIWKWLALSCFLCVIIITCAVLGPKLTGEITNEICDYWEAKVSGGALWSLAGDILPELLVLLGVYVLGSAVRYGNMYLMNNMVSRHYTCAIRIRMSDKIQRLPVKFVDGTPVGQILEQMTDDVSAMGNSIHQIVDTLMQGLLQIVFIAAALLAEDWRLGLIVLATTPVSMLLSVLISNASEKYYHSMFQEGAQLYSIVEEGYTNFSTTKAYNLEQAMEEKHHGVNQRQRKVQARAAFISGLVQPVMVLTNALTYIAVNLLGGYLVVKGSLPVGTVVTVILFARQFSAPSEICSNGADLRRLQPDAADDGGSPTGVPPVGYARGGPAPGRRVAGMCAGQGGIPACGVFLRSPAAAHPGFELHGGAGTDHRHCGAHRGREDYHCQPADELLRYFRGRDFD